MLLGLSIYRLIVAAFALYFVGTRLYRAIRGEHGQSLFKIVVTLVVWGGVLLFAVDPAIPRTISHDLGFGQNLNTLIFTGFIIVFAAMFRLLSLIERLERDITSLVREEALRELRDS